VRPLAQLGEFLTHLSESKDLEKLSSLGHFLKGSSATLGLSKVQKSCEKIQRYGELKDVDSSSSEPGKITNEEALDRIEGLLKTTRIEYEEAEGWLKKWYDEHVVTT
jgi:HPt (histidine-containing phosphotransfer) domain-containing protein